MMSQTPTAKSSEIVEYLTENKIPFTLIKHEPVHTCAEAENIVEPCADLFKSKGLFLKGKALYYVVVLHEDDRIDLKQAASLLGEKKLRFASADDFAAFGLSLGAIGPLSGEAQSKTREGAKIIVAYDRYMESFESIETHPNRNDQTIVLPVKGLLSYLAAKGVDIRGLALRRDSQSSGEE